MKHQLKLNFVQSLLPIRLLCDLAHSAEMTSIPDDPESVSVRAAVLAVEKSGGDNLSDSALGRSSYTASIAGVTTFSEVSCILRKRL